MSSALTKKYQPGGYKHAEDRYSIRHPSAACCGVGGPRTVGSPLQLRVPNKIYYSNSCETMYFHANQDFPEILIADMIDWIVRYERRLKPKKFLFYCIRAYAQAPQRWHSPQSHHRLWIMTANLIPLCTPAKLDHQSPILTQVVRYATKSCKMDGHGRLGESMKSVTASTNGVRLGSFTPRATHVLKRKHPSFCCASSANISA